MPVLVAATAKDAEGVFLDFGSEPQLVRRVLQKEIGAEVSRMRREKERDGGVLTRKEWSFIYGLKLLEKSAAKKDIIAIEAACSRLFDLGQAPSPDWPALSSAQLTTLLMSAPIAVLKVLSSGFFGRALEGTRLVYWIQGSDASSAGDLRMGPGIYCPHLKTAFVVNSILRDEFRICPKCQKTFHANYPRQVCCSVKCREAHRVARWRAAKKIKKGGR